MELVLREGRPALNRESKRSVRRSGKASVRKCAEQRARGKQADTQAKSMLNKRQCKGLRSMESVWKRRRRGEREREREGSGGN